MMPRGLRTPVVRSWPVSSWMTRRVLREPGRVLSVLLEKVRVLLAWPMLALPR